VTTKKSLTTTEGIVILGGKSWFMFNGRLVKKHMSDIFNCLFDLNGNKD